MIQTSIEQVADSAADSAAQNTLHDAPEDTIYGPAAWDRFFAELHEIATGLTATSVTATGLTDAPAQEEPPAAFSVGPDYLQFGLDIRG